MTQPTSTSSSSTGRRTYGRGLPPGTLIGFLAALLATVVIAVLSWVTLTNQSRSREAGVRTMSVLTAAREVFTLLQDAETGQRGFLLTSDETYLQPYSDARTRLPSRIEALRLLVGDDAEQRGRLADLERATSEKLAELQETIDLQRAGQRERALGLVGTDRGQQAMERIRVSSRELISAEEAALEQRTADTRRIATRGFIFVIGGALLLLVLILTAATIASRDARAKETESWLRAGQARLAQRVQGEQRLEVLGENVLAFLADYLGAEVGAFYVVHGRDRLQRHAGFALAPGVESTHVRFGEGLVGQAATEGRILSVTQVPAGYLTVSSGLGRADPAQLLVAPAKFNGVVRAVVELGFFRSVEPAQIRLLEQTSELVAIAVGASADRTRLEELLEETQRQSEELQTQQEELRVSNEELEEQGQALRQSQGRLEQQQAELEQTNEQLEEQARSLEDHADKLAAGQRELEEKAHELERSNQYKSEFLANMSHELRTPLNSSLILAKLLADNKAGNLTAEQVRFAQTVLSANQDLLALINDILDLSKIESGRIEIQREFVSVARLVESLEKTFLPLARDKGLEFSTRIEPGVPIQMQTDSQRLGQILKNLLSNALKFTVAGEVSLTVFSPGAGKMSFAVRDTGIGIAAEQHGVIFEAFRQADGSTHRRFGGTGLGLSISRDLARILGGDIEVHSTPGAGSTFTLQLPVVAPEVARIAEQEPAASPPTRPAPARPAASPQPGREAAYIAGPQQGDVEDDRDDLVEADRILLVVEDDVRFGTILRDLARELGFRVVVTQTGEDGLAAAHFHRPSAIVLDMSLPDRTGLSVLDALKRDPQTRHIPIHVVSVADYSQEALSRGAIGYALKPVQRAELVEALQRLEQRFSAATRRVLIAEDDPRQRESLQQLLGSEGVEIVSATNAREALQHLEQSTFDCMVLDLNLPDLSGYELLEQMGQLESVSFPPVIVYTGRSLSRGEEQRLRRFSRSIIIKDARSPERLLDEVTLFLHQVESAMPADRQRMLREARDREEAFEGRRILVVEDDVRNIFALSKILEPRGAQIDIARNGREALDILARAGDGGLPDLVLMDIMMPEMDGLTAMREIRKRPEWRKLPIIALTAKAMRDDQEKCLQAGANDYIAKPLDVERLLSLARVWMRR